MEDNQAEIERIKSTIQNRYDYLTSEEVDDMFNIALGDYIRLKYPSSNNRPKLDDIIYDFATSQWLISRMLDILGRAGGISVVAYKENNLNLTYGASYIDPELRKQIMPQGAVPR